MIDLNNVAKEIRNIITLKQEELGLRFIEETHTYYMKDNLGELRKDFLSVSSIYEQFHTPFPKYQMSLIKAKYDTDLQAEILKEWAEAGAYSTNQGSRVHYLLEKHIINLYGDYKSVREPIFICGDKQIEDSDKMIEAGKSYIEKMKERGAVLLDTEMVLGCNILNYVGQPDKVWLMINKEGKLGLVITDWKTNRPKNFEIQYYTKPMLAPFDDYMDTALSHYYIQLPLYMRLLLSMLKDSKYGNIEFFGGCVVLLKDDATYVEYKIPKKIINTVFELDMSLYTKEKAEH